MRLLPIIALAVVSIFTSSIASAEGLRAGAALSNITPNLGVDIVGGFAPFPAVHVHDELHARCLVLDDGKTKIALVICDLLGVGREVSIEARRQIQASVGIPPENVLIAGTHTHSAGAGWRRDSSIPAGTPLGEYQKFLAQRITDGVKRADNLLRPAEIAFGTAEAPEHVFNRRWVMKDGTAPPNPFGKIDKVKMNPPRSENLVEPAGPTDPTISFIALREPNGRLISVFAAYSLHYVGGVGPGHLSADYFAVFCEALRQQQPAPSEPGAPPFVAILANGTSGDINNNNYAAPFPKRVPYQQIEFVGKDVAGKVQAALAKVTWQAEAPLKAQYQELELQRKPIGDDLITWANETIANAPRIKGKTNLSFIYAERVLSLAKVTGPIKVPLQHLRIGDIGIGSFPTETFAETGLEFKKRSPVPHPFMVELAHDYLGYLPTPRHFELGGYETWPGTNRLEPQASVKMLDALLEMAAASGQ